MSKFDYVKTRREDVQAFPEKHLPLVRKVLKWYSHLNVWVYKKSRGRLFNTFPGGYPVCVVGMRGARSGRWREIPLIHLPQGENVYVVASQGGMPRHPVWYYNIKAHPEIEVTVGARTRRMRARQLSEAEKREAWPYLVSLYPDFDEYQARTDRDIPVFLCEPIDTSTT